ncbi:HlyD family type I secretion periplasmic adaptor subunit [Parahaliea maris]|uniref:Membrane fusion protein (MFP) family protein n=1 Tax=Parahaliea maris TaxID=2716870 RepID=A0A5C8ZQ63_9GAMM|nr:HlyD family type I secretion periplasmic adaptor subunit [Parahaliea maris]TXS89481.1 HlyD family type I secretion periplasmic adaptor subunit [Parahaliea maris]
MSDAGLRRPILVGVTVIVLFFGVLGGWATFSRLASAAIASGEIGFDNDRKSIQHLEGGIVAELVVADGQIVSPGELLVRLDKTQAQAVFEQVKARYLALLATESRLRSERDQLDAIAFPAQLDDPEFAAKSSEIKASESRLFATRRQNLEQQKGIIRQRIKQLEEEIQGLNEEIQAQDRQIALLSEEGDSMQTLFDRKLVSKQRLLALQRETADLEGERSRNKAAIARAQQSISEEELRLIDIETERNAEILAQLRDIQGSVLEINERLGAARDVLERTDIRSPIAGTVVGLSVTTVGGTIAPQQVLMDIVPSDEELLVKAMLDPKDIDVVRAGQTAFVRLTAFNQRNREPLNGEVLSVSADSLVSEESGLSYYLARISLPPISSEAYRDMSLYPGMHAEVMIQVGDRSPLDYLLQPITDSMNRALRED